MKTGYEEVIEFWFAHATPQQWFSKDIQLDNKIAERFTDCLQAAKQGELFSWRGCGEGRLAEIIVLDQFSRNIFREQPDAFAADSLALILAQEAVSLGVDKVLPATHRAFLYMPFMHSCLLYTSDAADD